MIEVETLVGEGIEAHNFYLDEVEAAIALIQLVKASRRRACVILRYRLGKRRSRRIAGRLRGRRGSYLEALSVKG